MRETEIRGGEMKMVSEVCGAENWIEENYALKKVLKICIGVPY